jgi:hypothetical protein
MSFVKSLGKTISLAKFHDFSIMIANEIIERRIIGQIIKPPEKRI